MTALPLFPEVPNLDEKDGVRFGIDWLAFTAKGVPRGQVVATMAEVLGKEWESWRVLPSGNRRERTKGPFGSLMEVDFKEGWVHVQIKGLGCRAVGTEALLALHDALHAKFGGAYRVKRVDAAWDDYRKRITPALFRSRFWDPDKPGKRPEVVCKALRGHAREDDSPEGGGSYQVGERTSKRMLRVYDKAAESGGKVNAIRIELECKEEVAAQVMAAMAASPGNRSAPALRFLVGFVDFCDVEMGRQVRPRRRSAWWEEFVGEAQKAKLSVVERQGLEEWRAEFTHQNSSGFRVLADLNGGDLPAAGEELFRANLRDNPRHAAWHEQIRKAREAQSKEKPGGGAGDGGAAA